MANAVVVLNGPKGLKKIGEWAGICVWVLFCLACGFAGVLAAFIH